jgi:hypothetical protein
LSLEGQRLFSGAGIARPDQFYGPSIMSIAGDAAGLMLRDPAFEIVGVSGVI